MPGPFCFLRKLGFLALLGFMAIVLVGPTVGLISVVVSLAVAAISVLLPFAIVGLLLWLPFRALTGRSADVRTHFRQTSQRLYRAGVDMPYRNCARIYRGARTVSDHVGQRASRLGSTIGSLFLEALSGAFVGGLLAAVVTSPDKFPLPEYFFPGIGLGAMMGIALGLSRLRSTPDTV